VVLNTSAELLFKPRPSWVVHKHYFIISAILGVGAGFSSIHKCKTETEGLYYVPKVTQLDQEQTKVWVELCLNPMLYLCSEYVSFMVSLK
jgi:hypothetical protein